MIALVCVLLAISKKLSYNCTSLVLEYKLLAKDLCSVTIFYPKLIALLWKKTLLIIGDDNNAELDNLFFEADNLIKDNLIGDAHDKLISIIQKNPRYGRAYNHLDWLFETKYKDLNKAEEYYQKALENSPEYIPIYLSYAICLSTMNKYDKLKSFLEVAMQVSGVNKSQLNNEYGIMYEMQGNFEKAISYYQAAINQSLNNNDINIYQESIERCIGKRSR